MVNVGGACLTDLIHPTAVIHPAAKLHPTVRVGPYAILGEGITVGAGTTIGAHVVLEGWTHIGVGNQIFPGAMVGLEPQDLKYGGAISYVHIGDYNLIREFATIHRATGPGEATVIGNHNLVMAYAHVAHNCVIGDHVILTNGVTLAGHVHVESQARIGGLVGVHQFVHIGRLAMVGGMTKLVKDVPPYMLVDGNPARVRSLNLIGLQRSSWDEDEKAQTITLLKKTFRLLYRSKLTLTQALEQVELLPNNPHVQHLEQFLLASQGAGRRGSIPAKPTEDG